MNFVINMRRCVVALIAVIMVLTSFSAMAQVTNFTALDDNPHSPRYNTMVGPYDAVNTNKITMWYHQYNKY